MAGISEILNSAIEQTQQFDQIKSKITRPKIQLEGIENQVNSDPIKLGASNAVKAPSFGQIMDQAVNFVDEKHKVAQSAISDILTGKSDNIHRAMILSKDSEMSFKLMIQVRNKLVEGYNELMRMGA